MDKLATKYQGQAEFIFVYGSEAHPTWDDVKGKPVGTGFEDRLAVAHSLRDNGKVKRRILLDELLLSSVRESILSGVSLDNPIVVVDAHGKIVYASDWLSAKLLDQFLQVYLPVSANP